MEKETKIRLLGAAQTLMKIGKWAVVTGIASFAAAGVVAYIVDRGEAKERVNKNNNRSFGQNRRAA